ncbi:MAG: type I restriction enzyme HsdR N-terminal domain-containing protein [Phreatobacter sp.]|nr:type I restriction enzyme HsdR N-terminal domain-containing protein [Phreatobacter sp.]
MAPPESIASMSRTPTPPGAAGPGPLHAALRQVAASIARLRADGGQVLEEDTKRILITPTIEALGWDHIAEIRNQYRHNRRDNPVDYALFLNRSPVLYVEAKPLGGSLDDRKWIVQTLNYANAAGVEWCVLTNGAEWRIYKVHAQVDAEEKRFATATIDQPETLDDAARVLDLLSRDNMRSRAIDELWQAWHVDRQVQQALEQTLQDDAFASLIRKRVPQLTLTDVRKSLRRANIAISYPGLIADLQSARQVPRPASTPAGTSTNGAAPTASRRRMQSTDDLFALGRLAAGTTLTIRGREDSAARVLDGQTVEFKGERLSFNDWGQRVTGWTSIRIYTMACLPDGRTLDQLRDSPASVKGGT